MPGERPKPPRRERGAAEQVVVAELLGERDGLEQAVARGVLAGVHLRLAAGEHELAAALLVGLGGEVEDPQRGVEQVGRLLVGERAQRLVAGALGVVERALRVARRGGLDEVVGELEQPGAAGPGARALERLADRPVQPRAADRAQVVVERLADQAVGEAEAAGLARRLGEQVQRERLVEALEQLGPRDAGRALERRDPEAAAGDGGDLEGGARRRGSAAAGGGGSRRGRRRAAAAARRARRAPWETSSRTTSSLKNGLPSVTAREAARRGRRTGPRRCGAR